MGEIIELSSFDNEQLGITKPIIYCKCDNDIVNCSISLNIKIAEKLSKYKESRRVFYLEQCFNQVISELPTEPVIKEFDVLFNPMYEIDVIKLLISAYRKKSFSVIWCGDHFDNKLRYSKEGLLDYKTYNIGAYDITCII